MADVDALLARGRAALAAGDWDAARGWFAEAGDSADALDGLAQALYCLADYPGAIDCAERAFTAHLAGGANLRAAMCARFVAFQHGAVHGNGSAAAGWMARATRLVDAAGDCPERARIELTRAALAADAAARDRHLAAATEIARRHGETDVVWDAQSVRGLHLVAAGDVVAGMALLDEALAAVTAGEVADLVSVGAMYCKMLHACEITSDVRRAQDWLALATRFVDDTNRIPIGAICRTHVGGVLTAAGRWADAERELLTAVTLYDRSYRALRSAALVRLAALRVRQGRLAEAEQLLVGAEHDSYAPRPQVELHLARGEPQLAAARIERYLREHRAPELIAPMLFLAVTAARAGGDPDAAQRATARLRAISENTTAEQTRAWADHAAGLTTAQDAAIPLLERALARFGRLGLVLEEGHARLDLARALAPHRPQMAIAEARTALAAFQQLTAAPDTDAAMRLLRELGTRGHSLGRHTAPGDGTLSGREREVLDLLGEGLSNADIAARLHLSRRTVEHHVSNILAKLGLRSRAAAAAYTVRDNNTLDRSG